MSGGPTTFHGESSGHPAMGWDERASLHRADDGAGLLGGFKSIREGTLAELIAFVAALPADQRGRYEIEKAGDHRMNAAEITALAARPDFPGL